ncbi:cold-inducible protein YdjO-related protein [Crassaminicella profunda]|uniref:cold-inducible protein YdjO-related protein n=1 Tax=Crassaminicella profunda TaxID=1286698 RepID=UPI001CA75EFF|nr:cold-inducible protein YdjO-related protein [Crassaminicella profunda]QZY55401.1 cold-shock protein [Crassaminicella profunda]
MFIKRKQEETPEKVYELKAVEIWQCPECIGWMQKEFSTAENPVCPFCSSSMVAGVREMNVIVE